MPVDKIETVMMDLRHSPPGLQSVPAAPLENRSPTPGRTWGALPRPALWHRIDRTGCGRIRSELRVRPDATNDNVKLITESAPIKQLIA
jgi:hypothetical protein